MLGHFKRNSQNDSLGIGASNVTFFPGFTLPLFSLLGRGGVRPSFNWQIEQPQQLWFNQATRLSGKAGVVNSQFVGQPLLDTRGPITVNGG